MDPPGDAGHRRRERSLRFGEATLLVIVAIVISCCGFGADALRPHAIPTAMPTDGTAPITGSVVLGADGHTIYYTDADGGCRLSSLSADQRGEGIRLSLSYSASEFCLLVGSLTPTATLQLAVPDVSQPIVDAVSGHAVPAFRQAGALHPSHVPVGATTANPTSLYGDVTSAVATFDGAGAATMAETFASDRSAPGHRTIRCYGSSRPQVPGAHRTELQQRPSPYEGTPAAPRPGSLCGESSA